jgi:AAA-like domain
VLALATNSLHWCRGQAALRSSRADRLGVTQRTKFFEEVLLTEIKTPVVVFVDEIDTTLSLNFTDDFFAAIRYFYNARARSKGLQRLSFVLIGVATPGDLQGTVTSIMVTLKKPIPLESSRVDLTKLKRLPGDFDVVGHFYYMDEQEGYGIHTATLRYWR